MQMISSLSSEGGAQASRRARGQGARPSQDRPARAAASLGFEHAPQPATPASWHAAACGSPSDVAGPHALPFGGGPPAIAPQPRVGGCDAVPPWRRNPETGPNEPTNRHGSERAETAGTMSRGAEKGNGANGKRRGGGCERGAIDGAFASAYTSLRFIATALQRPLC
jgi:hypothetical protein